MWFYGTCHLCSSDSDTMGRDSKTVALGFRPFPSAQVLSSARARAGVRPGSAPGSAAPAAGPRGSFSAVSVGACLCASLSHPAHRPAGGLGAIRGLVLTALRKAEPPGDLPSGDSSLPGETDLIRDWVHPTPHPSLCPHSIKKAGGICPGFQSQPCHFQAR